MNKEALRIKYKQLRERLTDSEIEEMSFDIANQLLKIDIWQHTYYHLFLSIREQKEIDTEPILNILFAKNKEIVIPKSDFSTGTLQHILLTENTRIKKNKHHIPEPTNGLDVPIENIEVVFIPLLAFDKEGNRVGYGKGFYDSFLNKSKALRIGLSFFEAEEFVEDTRNLDVPLHICITPNNIYKFNSK